MQAEPDLPSISAVAGLRPSLARVSLWTDDADRLEAFYVDLFGFRRTAAALLGPEGDGAAIVKAWNLPPGRAVRLVMLRAPRGDTELAIVAAAGQTLAAAASVRDGPPQAGSTYLVLYVPDLDAVILAAEARGAAYNRPPKRLVSEAGLTYYEMAVYDPDGRVLLIVQDVAPAGA